jgi:hypothetical protein
MGGEGLCWVWLEDLVMGECGVWLEERRGKELCNDAGEMRGWEN